MYMICVFVFLFFIFGLDYAFAQTERVRPKGLESCLANVHGENYCQGGVPFPIAKPLLLDNTSRLSVQALQRQRFLHAEKSKLELLNAGRVATQASIATSALPKPATVDVTGLKRSQQGRKGAFAGGTARVTAARSASKGNRSVASVSVHPQLERRRAQLESRRAPAQQQVALPSVDASAEAAGPPVETNVLASRVFSGPSQHPPSDFAAYGILAFRSLPSSSHDRDRYIAICLAYVNALAHTSQLSVAPKEQMVTVWPIDADATADVLNMTKVGDRETACDLAVDHYGLIAAQKDLKAARAAGFKADGIGPYLLAWAPTSVYGKKSAIVLNVDFSNVTTYAVALSKMQRWAERIEDNPEVWRRGWNINDLISSTRDWLDENGGPALKIILGSKR